MYKMKIMKLKNNTNFSFFLLTFLILFVSVSYAQDAKKIKSIIKASSQEIYQNPDKVIATGNKIVDNAGNDVNIKIRGYKLISDAYSSKRDYQKSLEYLMKANELLPKSNDKLLKIFIITKAGIQYHQLKIYDKAIQYLDQAEQLCLQYEVRDSVRFSLGINYIVRGFIYKEKLNCDIAIAFLDRGINEISQSKNIAESASKLSIAKYNKGNCYILMSDNKSAIKSFLDAISLAKKTNALSLQAFAQKGLAQVYTIEGKYTEAIELLLDAQKISSTVNDLVLNQEIYKGLSENYLAINEWNNYQKYQFKYLVTQTKLKYNEREPISDLLNKKENEVTIKLKSNSLKYMFGIVILLLASLLVIVFVLFYVRKSKRTIHKLKLEINNLQHKK